NGSLQSMGSGGMPSMDLSAPSANAGPQTAVLDADARLMFVLDVNRAELLAYRVKNGKLSAFPPQTYPLPVGTTSIELVKP
ncbi:MAG TPA: hypothetical protein VE133_02795, partial [Candidatus Sulfotelmatobacter sp.]|nr:hypothetical protein [Candidatus Sulfotelmatobacter sp.]